MHKKTALFIYFFNFKSIQRQGSKSWQVLSTHDIPGSKVTHRSSFKKLLNNIFLRVLFKCIRKAKLLSWRTLQKSTAIYKSVQLQISVDWPVLVKVDKSMLTYIRRKSYTPTCMQFICDTLISCLKVFWRWEVVKKLR